MQQKKTENKTAIEKPEKQNLLALVSSEQNLIRSIIQAEGEITDDIANQLDFVHEALIEKIDDYDYVLQTLENEEQKFRERAKFFSSVSSRMKKTREFLKDRLKMALTQRQDHLLSGSDIIMKLTKSKNKVNLTTEDAEAWLGKGFDDLIRKKVSYEFDKEAIREGLENGREIPFANLEESWNLRRSASTRLKK